MAHSKSNYFETTLVCKKCGRVEHIHRLSNRARPLGHYKKLFCITCSKRTLHIEVSEYDVGYYQEKYTRK